jgi:eukaryotic-like serine/threonine-protein kinase
MTMIVGAAHVLALRAAIVPGVPRRALIVGALTHVPVIAATWFVHTRDARPVEMPPVGLEIIATIMWSTISTVVSATIAWVIYGLQQKVRVAMELGQYTLLEKIGQGAMGTVYRARHALLRRPTAVKVLSPENAGEQTIARFSREVQLTSEISHPNVVSVYDFGRSPDGAFYYAMELLDGLDLQKLVEQDGPQPPARVAFLLQQIAEGLAEAHSVGLIHRDVKPGNVVVCDHPRRPDQIKVVDFGLVKQVGDADPALSAENVIAGTPLYMAPEAITSPRSIDARSDLYAVGAVGYFLLTGEPVFPGRTVFEVVGQTLHQSVTPPSERAPGPVPSKLERVLLACLSKAKEERPASASELLQQLRACDDVPVWSREDARHWWDSRGARMRDASAAQLRAGRSSEISRTLIVAPREAVSDESA